MTSLVEVGVEEAGAGRLEVDPHVRDRRARLEILVPELDDLLGQDKNSRRLPWRRASPRRRGWRAGSKRWRPWMVRQKCMGLETRLNPKPSGHSFISICLTSTRGDEKY